MALNYENVYKIVPKLSLLALFLILLKIIKKFKLHILIGYTLGLKDFGDLGFV
jgi:hypothetical protein